MSENKKSFVRPKVRFSEMSEPEQDNCVKNINNSERKVNLTGPKIRSIVPLKKPIKIVRLNEGECNEKNAMTKSIIDNVAPVSHLKNAEQVLSNDPHVQNTKPNCDVKKTVSSNTNDSKKHVNQKGKENRETSKINSVCSHTSKITKKSTSNSNIHHKGYTVKNNIKKTSSAKPDVKRILTPSLSSNIVQGSTANTTSAKSTKKDSNKKTNVATVMPCLKYKVKGKTSPVKKTVVRNIIGHKIKPHITAGLPHKQHEDHEDFKKDNCTNVTSNIASGDKLIRPEYNSIMCIVNKLNEVRNEKIVTDIEHLPRAYRNLVNQKVSSALNFPFDEAIYKNLVDLSIDDKDLPARLTRSKDPEPCQKDIIPKLSDFFQPEPTEEYCTPVSVKTRCPEMPDRSNAFRIINKIFEWEHNLDQTHNYLKHDTDNN